jgi:hypothetical protein
MSAYSVVSNCSLAEARHTGRTATARGSAAADIRNAAAAAAAAAGSRSWAEATDVAVGPVEDNCCTRVVAVGSSCRHRVVEGAAHRSRCLQHTDPDIPTCLVFAR